MTHSVMTTSVDVKTEPFRVLAGKAADYIREHGWCQGEFKSPTGAVCLIGATQAVPTGGAAYYDLCYHLYQAIGLRSDWNDHPDRAESEVLGVLDAISEGWL
jgi:hypothetical protein